MANAEKPTRPSGRTRAAEAADARAQRAPDDLPTPDEEQAAERAEPLDPDVAANYEDAIERGARQKGEGRVP